MRAFDWNEEKNVANKRKHGIGFEDAVYVFLDPLHIVLYDREHSAAEERWKAYGEVCGTLVVVSFTERPDTTWIISARKATRRERMEYYG